MNEQATTQTTTRYRVMVEGVVSNDDDVRIYCWAGNTRFGLSQSAARAIHRSLMDAAGTPMVHRTWIDSFQL